MAMAEHVGSIAKILEEFFKGLSEYGLMSSYIIQLQSDAFDTTNFVDITSKFRNLIERLIIQLQNLLSNSTTAAVESIIEKTHEVEVDLTCTTATLSDLTNTHLLRSSSMDINVEKSFQEDINANPYREIIFEDQPNSPSINTSIGTSKLKESPIVDESGYLSRVLSINRCVKELNLESVVQIEVETTNVELNSHCINDDGKIHLEASGDKLKCAVCGLCFKTRAEVKDHLQTSHSLQLSRSQNMQTCDICSKVFACTVSLQEHFRCDHPGAGCFLCQTCGKRLTTRMSLTRHQDIHSGIREAVCKFCGKAFSRSDYLRIHYASHLDKRKFACSHCPSKFNRNIQLKIHEKIHSGVKDHICEECGIGFVRKDKLKEHKLRHLKIKRFPCHVCLKQYAEARDLNKHLKSHPPTVP